MSHFVFSVISGGDGVALLLSIFFPSLIAMTLCCVADARIGVIAHEPTLFGASCDRTIFGCCTVSGYPPYVPTVKARGERKIKPKIDSKNVS